MNRRYRLRKLSEREQEFLTTVLLDEMELQTWYSITFSSMFNDEIFVILQ